jgi:hypothetical protein
MHGLSEWGALAYGVIGGALPEFLAVYRKRDEPQKSAKVKRFWTWWLPTVGMIAAGGGLAFVYVKSGNSLNPFLAINVGASTPLILGSLVSTTPTIPPGKVDEGTGASR